MDWVFLLLSFGLGWALGSLSSRRGSNGAALGVIATVLAFIGLN